MFMSYQSAIAQASTNYNIPINMNALNAAFEALDVQQIDSMLAPFAGYFAISPSDRQALIDMKNTHKQDQKQKRDVLFDSASVLIKMNPELWQELPPGADDYWKQLNVTKYDN